ncbi:uncharacterized protein LOC127847802 [Dreissena polymorpha]|uniref:uncharacterized protein LOC127847802 n=1 Tax=Dreissena polymorpha TaxID=45954 RepID=UPI002263FAFC|nr:uncharacterized protein LOC127847802 [Dreissena polymorpha]
MDIARNAICADFHIVNNNTQHLGLHGCQEHLTMLWGDLELKQTNSERKYLDFTERARKTRKCITYDSRSFKAKLFEQKAEAPDSIIPNSRFYLTPSRYWDNTEDAYWFLPTPMGKKQTWFNSPRRK